MGGTSGPQPRGVTATPILASMVVGALVGWLIGPTGSVFGFDVLPLFDFLGTLFINMLKMVVVPLISASIITGVANLVPGRDLGPLGLKTLFFYVITTLLAVLTALTIVNIVKPGIVNGEPAKALLALEAGADSVTATVKEDTSTGGLESFFAW